MDLIVGSRAMIDIEREESLIRKVGGKFALTVLLQKRMVELNRGAPPLVRTDFSEKNLRKIAAQEILEGKITLGENDEVEYTKASETKSVTAGAAAAPPPPEEGSGSEIYGSDIKKIKEQRIKELAQLLNPKK
jgi:DNA-directed RNA polymerase subunit omega